jgi:hypothetical protein
MATTVRRRPKLERANIAEFLDVEERCVEPQRPENFIHTNRGFVKVYVCCEVELNPSLRQRVHICCAPTFVKISPLESISCPYDMIYIRWGDMEYR